ncbi:MAG TPA: CHAT domain-containing protein, partial [Thermoanaerobaculia bacterium]|nr:CHAT domain-containing protein [Thermoanaerobaculia bacterium]
KRLTAATEAHPNDASLWNDLAAARYTAAIKSEDPQQLVSALAAADHALRIAPLPESEFNRGMILESLGLNTIAASQYASYGAKDTTSMWAAEARQRIAGLRIPTAAQEWRAALPRLRRAAVAGDQRTLRVIVTAFPQEARTWGQTVFLGEWAESVTHHNEAAASQHLQAIDAIAQALLNLHGERFLQDTVAAIRRDPNSSHINVLANAQITYVRGRKLYAARNVGEALPLFRTAAIGYSEVGNPMARVAAYYLGCALFDRGSDSEAQSTLQHQIDDAPKAYVALHAELLWEMAEVMTLHGHFYDALSAESQAASLFSSLGERDNAATVESQAAATASLLGRRPEAWRRRIDVFHQASSVGDTLLLQRVIDVAARTEALDERWDSAYALFLIAVDKTLLANPRIHTNSAIWAGLTAHKLGLFDRASAHLKDAHIALATIPDAVLRRHAEAELTLAEATVAAHREPQRAQALLGGFIAEQRRERNTLFLPEAFLQRARIAHAAGNIPAAINDLTSAAAILRLRNNGPEDEFHDAFFRTTDAVARGLTESYYDQGDLSSAFKAIDNARTEAVKSQQSTNAAEPDVPPGTLIVEYVAYPGRLLILTRDATGVSARVVAKTTADIERSCRHRTSALEGFTPECYDLLLRPIEPDLAGMTRLIIIPDHLVASVPFAALRTGSGKYLLETVEIVMAPSSAFALTPPRGIDATAVAVVGDPAFDRSRFPDLPSLPAALREAKDVAALYPTATLLTGTSATRDSVLSAMKDSSIVHLASHAVVVGGDSRKSHLVLAPSGTDPGMLFLSDLDRHVLRRAAIVVVAGCNTAVSGHETTNVGSLALAFLAAGASNVIATLHDVDDNVAATFSANFHHELKRGATPAAALRAVQLAMLHSPDTRMRSPSVWSSFQVYGSAIASKATSTSVHTEKEN